MAKPVDKDTRGMVAMEMDSGGGPNDKSGYYGPCGEMFWNEQQKIKMFSHTLQKFQLQALRKS